MTKPFSIQSTLPTRRAHFGLIASALLLFSCSVRAGNPDDETKKFTLSGQVAGMEDKKGFASTIKLTSLSGNTVATALSATDGTYLFHYVHPGSYDLQVGPQYRQGVQINDDKILNVFVPIPAAPANFREVELGPDYFCLLWDDKSGVESGFHIFGPVPLNSPANKIGWVKRTGFDPDSLTLAIDWNEAFAGTYMLQVFNEYGASASLVTTVYPHAVTEWTPDDPRRIGIRWTDNYYDSQDANTCRNALEPYRYGFDSTFVEP